MAKALKTIGTAIVIAGLAVATGGAAIALGAGVGLGGAVGLAGSTALSIGGFSISASALVGAGTLIQSAASLNQPKVQRPGATIEWTADPDAPLHFAFGRVGVAGQIVHNATFGPDKMYVGFVNVFSAAGPIDGYESFTADEKPVTFNASGMANSSEYAGEMWRRVQTGAQPTSSAMTVTGLKNGASMPNWDGASRLSGKAAELRVMGENSKRSAYGGQVPVGLTTLRGQRCWDPRQDSTYPGGMGSCRLNDPSTWVYTTNAYLHALKWTLGLWEGPNGRGAPQVDFQVGGVGARSDRIDIAAYVEGANLFEANGWACAAWPSTDDDKAAVLDSFLQAGGGLAAQKKGRMSCVHRIAPRASVATITGADTAGPIELTLATPRKDRINTLRPRYWSEEHQWQMTAAGDVTSEAWQIEDGQGVAVVRPRGIDYNYVPQAQQATELAALQIAHTREGISGVIPLRPYMQALEVGDCITLDEPDFVLDGLKCLILDIDDQADADVLRVSFISETDGKYPFAYGEIASPPPAPTLEPRDLTFVEPPGSGDWTVVVRPGGVPGFDLAGVVSNAMAARVLVEIGYAEAGPWTGMYDGPPTTERVELIVQPNSVFWVAVSYFNAAGNPSGRTVYGPFESGDLVAGDTTHVGGRPADELIAFFREVGGSLEENDRAAELLIDEALSRHAVVVEEARQRVEGIAAEAQARGTAIGAVEEEIAVVITDLGAEVTTRETQYAAIGTSVALVEAEVSTVATALSAETTTRESQISAVNASISGVQTNVNTVATNLSALTSSTTSQFSTVNGTLANHTSSINTNASAISAETSARTSAISAVNASIAAVQSDVNTVATDLAAEVTARTALAASTTSGLATVNTTLTALSNTDTVQSGLIATAQSTANGASSAATFAIEALNGEQAYIIFYTDVGGRVAGQKINGVTGDIDFLSEIFRISSISSGARTEFQDGVWYAYPSDNATRSMWGKPFGGTHGLVWWTGPNSVPIGSESKANAYVYVSMNTVGGPRFGGSDVPGVSLSATPSGTYFRAESLGPGTLTTPSVTVTVGGGTSGATVRWVNIGGDPTVTPTNPTGFTTAFTATVGAGEDKGATFVAFVTRAGQTTTTEPVVAAIVELS